MAAQLSRLVPSISAAARRASSCALSARQATAVAALSALFALYCCVPIRPGGIFRDLIDAEAMLSGGKLPSVDPLLPYADDARFVVLNPLGALIERAAWTLGGTSGLILLSAALATAASGLWCGWAVRRHGSFAAAAPTLLWTLFVGWSFYDSAGTFRIGLVLMPLSFLLLDRAGLWTGGEAALRDSRSSGGRRRIALAATPILFALWANLDASWILGLAALWLVVAGRTIEILVDRRARRASGSASLCTLLPTSLASTLATLANPYGWKLWGLLTLPSANDPFVATLGPFEPMAAWSYTGILAALLLTAAGIGLAARSLRVRWVESLALAFGLAYAFASAEGRLWTLPLLGAMVLPPVWREALDRLDRYRVRQRLGTDGLPHSLRSRRPSRTSASRWTPSALAMLSIAGSFFLTPISDSLQGGEGETLETAVIDAPLADVPSDAFEGGITFVAPWWSEAFAFQRLTKRGENDAHPLRLLADSRQATLPPSVREDVSRVLAGDEGWAAILDRYETKTLLLDVRRQSDLVELVRTEPRWREVAATDALAVFRREERRR